MFRRLVLLASLSGCGLFPDLSLLSGEDAGGSDAMSDATSDVSTFDVTSDAPPSDAGLDVKKSPCSQPHTFCDDFDDGSLGATWDKSDNTGGGILSQSTNAVSPPYAFQAQVPGGGGHPDAILQEYLAAAQHVHYECDIVIMGSQSTNMEIDYFDFAFQPAGYSYGNFNLEQLNPGATLEEISRPTGADASAYNDDNFNLVLSSWKHVVVDIDFAKSTFTLAVDGVTIDAMSMKPVLASSVSTLGVGVTYSGGLTAPWTVLIDNVVVDLQ